MTENSYIVKRRLRHPSDDPNAPALYDLVRFPGTGIYALRDHLGVIRSCPQDWARIVRKVDLGE